MYISFIGRYLLISKNLNPPPSALALTWDYIWTVSIHGPSYLNIRMFFCVCWGLVDTLWALDIFWSVLLPSSGFSRTSLVRSRFWMAYKLRPSRPLSSERASFIRACGELRLPDRLLRGQTVLTRVQAARISNKTHLKDLSTGGQSAL